MLSVSHLTRRFGDRVAVEDISFEIAAGEIFALLGPNGAGKTTTLRMLAGLIKPTSGHISVTGRIGLLTEAPGLWDRLTVRLNLLTYARLHGMAAPDKAVDRVLETFGLRDRAEDATALLSKGLKQRVALARTLLHEPEIVLLDEPTAGLDPEMARDVRDLVLRLRDQRRAVIVSTHNLDEVERVATRVAVLRTHLIAVDTPAALRARLFGARVRVVLTQPAASLVDGVARLGFPDVTVDGVTLSVGVGDPVDAAPRLVRHLVEAGADIRSVVTEEVPLEQVYLRLLEARS